MPRPSKARSLAVWMNGVRVGAWRIDGRGAHEFRYDKDWLVSADVRPISLSMPLQPPDVPYRDQVVEGFFDNLLPDAVEIRRRIQARFGAASTSAFDLLAEIGRDCVGAIQLLPLDQKPEKLQTIESHPLDEQGVAQALRAATSAAPLGQREEEPLRISIAGAQEKTALLKHDGRWHRPLGSTPSTYIFKLPLGRVGNMQADLSTSAENEWLCSRIVSAFGLPAAECEIGEFEGQRTLIVERFDRRLSSTGAYWLRLPQEDMCQATGTPPALKYESDGGPGIDAISRLLLGSRNAAVDRRRFFTAQVVFWMLCATDGHAKNFSVFIEPGGRYSLTPLYDVLSAYPILGTSANQLAPQKAKLAMAVIGKNRHYKWAEILPRHWLTTAAAVGLDATVREDIGHLVQCTPHVINEVSAALPAGFPTNVSGTIFDGLSASAAKLAEIA
jgi:serine/threonine-protein kinase HipA